MPTKKPNDPDAKPKGTKKPATKSSSASVDWKSIKTAAGSGSRIPALVKSIAAANSDHDCFNAAFALRKTLVGEGSVAPSTAPTVTLLLDVVVNGKGGAFAAQLIGDALSGGHLHHLAHPDAAVVGPIDDVRAAALAGRDALLAALDHDDPRLRTCAAFALAFLPALEGETRSALRRRLPVETDDDAAVSQGLALAWLCRNGRTDDDDRAFAEARRATSAGSRAGAAVASLVLGEANREGLVDLAATAGKRLNQVIDLARVPWGEGAFQTALLALAKARGREHQMAVAWLESIEETASMPARSAVGQFALKAGGFSQHYKQWEVALPDALSEQERAIAVGLARFGGIDGLGWGVPRSVRDRRRWLGLAPAGALEKRIQVDGRELPVWYVWQKDVANKGVAEFPAAVLAALTPDEIVEAHGEVLTLAYGIKANRKGPPLEPVLAALPRLTKRSAEWARAFWREASAYLETGSTPELGNVLGIAAAEALYLALVFNGESVPAELHANFPVYAPAVVKVLVERMGPTDAEEAVWSWMNAPRFADRGDFVLVGGAGLLAWVSSKRIVERLGSLLESKAEKLGADQIEKLRAALRDAS
ncbi:MAG TPA: hypothetical protein VF316_02935 [Polyangiaceae bacterium]